jgi:hypothetical protein
MAKVAEQLLRALDALDVSPQFCVAGSVDPVLPGLEVEGVGPVGVPVSPDAARQLIAHAAQAPYGRGEETIVDTDVRRVWQIEPSRFALNNPQWDALLEGIVEQVKAAFSIKGKVKADLYKLLVYEEGSFFAPHRDTEKVDGMFATLVVCLPSRHEGGALLVRHDRQTQQVDFGGAEGEFKVQYAAFYTDCRHEIKPVTKGYRVCLVYNLALAQRKRQPEAPRHGETAGGVAGLLAELFADGSRDKVAIALKHEYTQAGLSFELLKGTDRSRVEVLRRAAEQLKYHVYLALMIYRQQGSPDEETVRYTGRWGERVDEDSVEMGEVYEEELVLDHWLDTAGRPAALGKMDLCEDQIVSKTDFEDLPIKQEVHEATGNEGATVERWYRQAVVVVWPPDRYFRLLAGQGQAAALPTLEELVGRAKDPSADEPCRTLAREILRHWKLPRYGRSEAPDTATMLKLLERIADPALVKEYVQEVLPKDHRGTEGLALCKLANRVGWEGLGEGLTRFVASRSPDSPTANLPAVVSIVEGLCCGPGEMTAERKAVCRAVANELENIIRRWDAPRDTDFSYWGDRGKAREGVLESLARVSAALDVGELLEKFLRHALADREHYPLHTALIPAVKEMFRVAANEAVLPSRQRLLQRCTAELERLTAKPVEEPRHWAQDITLRCTCGDCRELQLFLHDPQETVHRFRVAEARRRHLHQQIDMHGCDMTHVTERTGSPYTLVCTKNRASYERKKADYETNVRLLKELRVLERPKRLK